MERLKANYKILLVEGNVVVILRGNLHEVAACARIEEVVHCSGRSGKTVKAQKYNGVRDRKSVV